MIKILNQPSPKMLTPAEMRAGQVGIIRKWSGSIRGSYIGRIVVKGYDGELNSLDPNIFGSGSNWDTANEITDPDSNQVEILPPGTKLEITLE